MSLIPSSGWKGEDEEQKGADEERDIHRTKEEERGCVER